MIVAEVADLLSFAAAIERAPEYLFHRLREAFAKAARDHNSLVVRHLKIGKAIQDRRGDSGIAGTIGNHVAGNSIASLTAKSFTTSRYGKVHELGTVGAGGSLPDIRPRVGKFLAIPVGVARTASGARDRGRLGPKADPPGSAGDFPGGRFIPKGNGFVYVWSPGARDTRGRGLSKEERGRGVVVFVLKRSVAMPSRPWFFPAWVELEPVRARDFGLAAQSALRDVTRAATSRPA